MNLKTSVRFLSLLVLAGSAACAPDAVETIGSPAAAGSAQPHLATGPTGEVVLSWLEPAADGAVALRYALLNTNAWSAPRTVASGADWFVNWADFPSVEIIDEGFLAAHWLAKTPGGTYSYDVAVAISTDGGKHWSAPVRPHDDGTRTEHGFASLFPFQGGVGAIWLDGREMAEDGAGHGAHAGGMTLRSAVIGRDGSVSAGEIIDDLVCDCCQTDVGLAESGPVALYRDRTAEEIRDIHVARAIAGRWHQGGAVVADNWSIAGCPVNGPAIATRGRNIVAAWFTAAQEAPRVRFAWSTDGGQRFGDVVDIDDEQPVGRVDTTMLDDKTAAVSWMRRTAEGQAQIVARRVTASGKLGRVIVVAANSAARAAGFPQMVRSGDQLVFAWTDLSVEPSVVRTARVATAAF